MSIVLPVLRPVPLKTKGKNVWRRTKAWFLDARVWEVMEDYVYQPDGWPAIMIPAGFLTDFASVPRAFWGIGMEPTGILLVPSLIHDFGYRHDFYLAPWELGGTLGEGIIMAGNGKGFHDQMMRRISAEVNGMKTPGWLAAVALGAFGWPAWWAACRRREEYRIRTGEVIDLRGEYAD